MFITKRSRFTFDGKPVYFSRKTFTDDQFDPRTGIFTRILQSVLNEAAYDEDFVRCLELGKVVTTTVQACYAVRPLVVKVAKHHDVMWAQHAGKGFAKTFMPFALVNTIPEEELGRVTVCLVPKKNYYVLKAVYGGVRI